MTNAEEALKKKSDESGMPYRALLAVYKRGIGAWKTNPASVRLAATGTKNYSVSRAGKMGKEQWAFARTAAFIDKKPSVYYGSDDDIRRMFGLR